MKPYRVNSRERVFRQGFQAFVNDLHRRAHPGGLVQNRTPNPYLMNNVFRGDWDSGYQDAQGLEWDAAGYSYRHFLMVQERVRLFVVSVM